MVVLTIASSIGIPAYFGQPDITLNNAAELLAKDLRDVQHRAALYEEELWVRFDEDGGGYRGTDRKGGLLISPYGAGPFIREYDFDATFRGVSIESIEPNHLDAYVFDARGFPRTSIAVTLRYKDDLRTVAFSHRTGIITFTTPGEGDAAQESAGAAER